jgi:hypothetical protein
MILVFIMCMCGTTHIQRKKRLHQRKLKKNKEDLAASGRKVARASNHTGSSCLRVLCGMNGQRERAFLLPAFILSSMRFVLAVLAPINAI